jgi:hypothetical protein
MKCTNATKVHRKSGVAEGRDLRCAPRPSQILEFSRRLFSPSFRDESLFRWTEVQLPLLKQGTPTRFGLEYIGGSFFRSHAGVKALAILVGVARLKSCPDTKQEDSFRTVQSFIH